MNKKILRRSIIVILLLIVTAVGFALYLYNTVSIKSIELTSPSNLATEENVNVVLDKEEPVFIKYWKEGSNEIPDSKNP